MELNDVLTFYLNLTGWGFIVGFLIEFAYDYFKK